MGKALALALVASQCWGALLFGDATTNSVACGSAASIDDVFVGTAALWYRPATTANAQRYMAGKSTQFGMLIPGADGTAAQWKIRRATVHLTVDTPASSLAANTWVFLAATWDTAGSAPVMYRGSLTAAATDVSTNAAVGSGTANSNAASNLAVGNSTDGATASAHGRVTAVAIWSRRLTLGEIVSYQFRPRATSGNVFFWRGYTTANHADWSGQAHACTVTGATVADEVPIGPWFGFDWRNQTLRMLGLYA